MKTNLLVLIASSFILSTNSFAGTAADTVDLSLLTPEQEQMVQLELNTFSEIASTKITAENKNKYEKKLQQVIYCGYDAFMNNQSQFSNFTESNEKLIFNTPTLMSKYKSIYSAEHKLPMNPAICSKLQS
ncbi:hypothetical protein C9J21_20335 [Photobacterium phosphoreum]|uniref:hypothetical protein n=1 Tax=Photobacterium phosphoreum TaxID=659 RepID=UPI000D1648FC|nr:hypothetical protein [Photobacterium phosphoreum]PSW28698.1 hypothetical protein C9J21_20335 [Photobacterium phosphoreum]